MKRKSVSMLWESLILIPILLLSLYPLLFSLTGCTGPAHEKHSDSGKISGKISISGAFALYPLTVTWAEEFMKLHPDVSIDISAGGAGKGMADVLSGMVDLAMFSREITNMEITRGAWKLAVAKDAVFPTINTGNPEYQTIMKTGLTRNQFREVFQEKIQTWDSLLIKQTAVPLHVYTRSDACGAAAMWAAFLGLEQENLRGTGVYGDPGMADAVKNDKLGIGYNNLVFLYDLKTKKSIPGLSVLPIDLNENRIIDPVERMYDSLDTIMQAIVTGRYPSPPARRLYLVSKGVPVSPAVTAFLRFILNEGQQMVALAGYICLDSAAIAGGKAQLELPVNEKP